uniref:Uncharacterized protein n=1 Tax=Magallana gigas TaxID=29159 RepID=K1PPY4_MAGGI
MAIEVDVEKAMNDEIKFYISENDVVLTEGNNGYILPKYFKKAYKIISRMTAHLRNSTGTNVYASRDDRTLAPTAQPNASRECRTLALERPEHQHG